MGCGAPHGPRGSAEMLRGTPRGKAGFPTPTTTSARTERDPRGSRHHHSRPSSCSPARSLLAAPMGMSDVACGGDQGGRSWAGSGLSPPVSGWVWKGLCSWVGKRRGNLLGACHSSQGGRGHWI